MPALVKRERAPGLNLEEVPVPEIGHNDVLIRVQRGSICGTDVHIYNWDAWAQKTIPVPMTIGHEFVGVIEKIGAGVHDFKEGELVTTEGHIVCGHCRNCLAGRRHLCPNTKGIGVNRPGGFAEYVSVPSKNLWRCEPKIPLDILSCSDPLGNAVHTALAFDLVGEDVLITGAGPIGCMAVPIAKMAGARKVVITDINPYRLDLARKMGATLAIDVRERNLHDAMKELDMREGFDVGREMSGNPKAFTDKLVVFHGLTIKGIYGREMFETWYKMTALIQSGLDISPVITHRFPYTDFREAIELMKSGNSGKIVLNWANV